MLLRYALAWQLFVITFYRTGIDLFYWVEQADDRFLWNKVLMQELIEQKVRDLLKFHRQPRNVHCWLFGLLNFAASWFLLETVGIMQVEPYILPVIQGNILLNDVLSLWWNGFGRLLRCSFNLFRFSWTESFNTIHISSVRTHLRSVICVVWWFCYWMRVTTCALVTPWLLQTFPNYWVCCKKQGCQGFPDCKAFYEACWWVLDLISCMFCNQTCFFPSIAGGKNFFRNV